MMTTRIESLRAALANERHLHRMQSGPENKAHTKQRIDAIERQIHELAEGSGVANDHPDGCYYCGSPLHHSTDCRDRD